jgi:alanine racemase
LKESGIDEPILILGRLFPDEIPIAVKAGFRISIYGREDIRWIENARQDAPAIVHVKIETGMGRMGLLFPDAPAFFDDLVSSGACSWEGLFSHFSTADEEDKTYSHLQLSRFSEFRSLVQKLDKKPAMIHMASSGGILDIPQSYFDAVRPGILMYGHYPSLATSHRIEPRQVMTLKTVVAHVRDRPEGHAISYGRRWTTPGATRIAVLPLGYADGMSRKLTNNGEVLIQGRRYPMVGTVTMDYIMVNVGRDPIRVGDEVMVWGESSQGTIQAWEVAERISTIPYELTCAVSERVRRVYIDSV